MFINIPINRAHLPDVKLLSHVGQGYFLKQVILNKNNKDNYISKADIA